MEREKLEPLKVEREWRLELETALELFRSSSSSSSSTLELLAGELGGVGVVAEHKLRELLTSGVSVASIKVTNGTRRITAKGWGNVPNEQMNRDVSSKYSVLLP